MKLSELVDLRERLKKAFYLDPVLASIDDLRLNLSLVNQNVDENYNKELDLLIKDYRDLRIEINRPSERVQEIIDTINKEISSKSSHFFLNNYEDELVYENPANIRNIRKMHVPMQIQQEVESRIGLYSSWRYPALELGCRDGEWTKLLVASDPLYITDEHQEFLDNAVKDHTHEYQRRVRPYLIKNNEYGILPQNQFNFVFSWNHFNYKTLDTIKQNLKQVYNLLRPGGVCMFSYNNGDIPMGAGHAETYFMSYVPKSLLMPIILSLGYEVVYQQDHEPAISWIEIRRPGELATVKAHQAMGTIKENIVK
jgi:SAM-dependent methyltransferase